MMGGYYSTCAMLTEDGTKCGLGGDNGFRYRSNNSSNSDLKVSGTSNISDVRDISCIRECATDLCPAWLTTLLTKAPTQMVLKYHSAKRFIGHQDFNVRALPILSGVFTEVVKVRDVTLTIPGSY